MRTRRGLCYPRVDETCTMERRVEKRRRDLVGGGAAKKWKPAAELAGEKPDLFDALHDDLVVSILCKLSSSASCPLDFINALSTCRRFKRVGLLSTVLANASTKMLSVRAEKWSESAHRFLKLCADAGSTEACYTLGMIRFYCLKNRGSGASLMAKAAICSHTPALYSLAVIQFNGSGGQKSDKDLRAGVALCARAAFLGHIDALRELGHCLQDGYGVQKNFSEGRRFLLQANARELASALATGTCLRWDPSQHRHRHLSSSGGCPLFNDFGYNVPVLELHPVNRFLREWFEAREEGFEPCLRLCSNVGCGRLETRKHEFRRCSVCGGVNYCSRACQALDWKRRHKAECVPVDRWLIGDNNVDVANVGGDGNANGNEDMMVVDS